MVDLSSFYSRGEINEIICRRVVGCDSTQSSFKEFLETIMIMTYFHGSNVDLVWFWEKEDARGRRRKLGKIIILYSSWKFMLRDDSRVEKSCATSRRGGEYGIMLYLDYCNGKWLRKIPSYCVGVPFYL
jgi:hypothetical protein